MDDRVKDTDGAVGRVLDGDRDAYRQIVEGYEVKVRVLLAAMLPDNSWVEDLTQEVFLTAFMKLSEYRIGTSFDAWIREIARNYARNERRKWIRSREAKEKHRAEIERLAGERLDAITEDSGDDVFAAIHECIDELKDRAGEVVKAFYFEEESGKAIAEKQGKPEGWVRLVLFRARAAIAECMSRKGVVSNA
jgi:RNA polymerase sigma-70 factor (ECF subfamily)